MKRNIGKNNSSSDIYRNELSNGMRIIALPVKGRKSIAIGAWILSGASCEPKNLVGVSHFIEHLVFKGTKAFSGKNIVSDIERLGGNIDAYTTREETCYYATMLGEDMEIALKIIADLVCNPLLRKEDVELERQVILSEMSETFDDPSALAQEIFPLLLFGDSPLGRPILGLRKTIENMQIEQLHSFWSEHYSGGNIILGASGAVTPQSFSDLAEKLFTPSRSDIPKSEIYIKTDHDGKLALIKHPSQQIHFILGIRTFPYSDENRFTLAVLDVILGRSSASRLFQRIREQLGLAYNIQSFSEYYKAAGFWGIYAGTAIDNFSKLLSEIFSELKKIAQAEISDSEFNNAKTFLRGRLLLSSESPWNQLSRAIESEIFLKKFISFEDVVEKVMSISLDDVANLAKTLFVPQKIVAMALGDVKDKNLPDVGLTISKMNIEDIFPC